MGEVINQANPTATTETATGAENFPHVPVASAKCPGAELRGSVFEQDECGRSRIASGKLVESQTETGWEAALAEIAMVFPECFNPHL